MSNTGPTPSPSEARREVVPLSVPELTGDEAKNLCACVESGWVSSAGPFVEQFEAAVADVLDAPHAIAVSSGTAALHVAMLLAGVEPDDEVVVPTITFIASANAVRYVGAHPVFLDVEPRWLQLDVEKTIDFLTRGCRWIGGGLRNRATGRRVRALTPVHLLGHPVEMKPLCEAASKYELIIVEDAAESLGAKFEGRPVGGLGDVGCLSFNGNKTITAGGGGMVVCRRSDWADRARYLTTQAKDDSVESIHGCVGFNYRLSNLHAAVGSAQLARLEEFVERKRRIARNYQQSLSEIPGLSVVGEAPWAFSTYWLSTIRVDEARFGESSRELMRRLEAAGIQTRPLWQPLHRSPAYSGAFAHRIEAADEIHAQALCLPSSVGLTPEQQRRVIEALRR